MKRLVAALLCTGMITTSLMGYGCTEVAAETEELSGKITLAVPEGNYVSFMNDVVLPRFYEKYPDVTVDVIADKNIETMISAGEYPNVYTGGYGARGMRYAKSGVLTPLNQFEDYEELAAKVDDKYLTTYADYNFYIPWNCTTTMMVYNKELFREAGLDPEDPPATFDEFLEAAKAIDELGDDIYGTVFWNDALAMGGWYWNMLAPIYYNFNGGNYQLLNGSGTDIVFDDPEAKTAEFLEFLKEAQQYAPESMHSDGSVGFFKRNIGMWLQFGYGWKANLESAEGEPMVIGEDIGIAPVPTVKEGDTSWSTLDANGLVIFKTDENSEKISWELVKCLMEEDLNMEACKQLGQLPTLLSLQGDEYFEQPSEQPFVQQSLDTLMAEPYAEADTVANILLGAIQSVTIEGSATPEEAVQKAAEDAKTELASE